MSEKDYIVFVLGYDLLYEQFNNTNLACDEAFGVAQKIADEFITSKEYQDFSMSMYSALSKWLSFNLPKVNSIIYGTNIR